MRYLVAYDISDNSTRAKVSRLLSRYGYRIQLSVFFLPDVSEAEVEALYITIKGMVDRRRDRVFFYPVEEIEIFEGYPYEPWSVEVV
jgi:CRISPR-associated protein Cas2